MARPEKKQVFIVSHTHWDREWYLPFHQFRMKLIRTVDSVLSLLENDPEYKHFVLDGQAIILEDYLELQPGDKERIKKQADSGKLSIGPWYILPDEFLVSGESTIRNLIIGKQVCAAFGRPQVVGYMPDSFGHITQMPQILRQAGIDSFIYTRGSGDELDDLGVAYQWIGPDGSSVLAINQIRNYCNAGALGYEEFWLNNTNREPSIELAVAQGGKFLHDEKLSIQGIYLFNNGCDHLLPQPELPQIIKALQKAYPQTTFLHCDYTTFLDAVKDAGTRGRFEGELRNGKYHYILSGVWSTRMYLKQINEYCQNLLELYLEPFATFCFFQFGIPYPMNAISYCWKLLLKNHPHDSICGSSTDVVHAEMIPRFNGVIQTAQQVINDNIEKILPGLGKTPEDDLNLTLFLFNSLPFCRAEVIQRLLYLPNDVDLSELELVDESGQVVDFEILKRETANHFEAVDLRAEVFTSKQLSVFDLYRKEHAKFFVKEGSHSFNLIQFGVDDFPALGHRLYRFEKKSRIQPVSQNTPVHVSEDTVSNEFLRATLHADGRIDLEERIAGTVFKGLNGLESTEDIGDEYDYSPSEDSRTINTSSCHGVIKVEEKARLSGKISSSFAWSLPKAIAPGRTRRSEESVDCMVRIGISLSAGSRFLEVEVTIDNQANDHRVRAIFPTPIQTDKLVSDGHFYINERKMRPVSVDGWVQAPVATHPQQAFSLVHDGRKGLAVFNKGLPEVEGDVDGEGRASIKLTLMRSVGWLSRGDLLTRRGNAGPMIATPDAQCLGRQTFQYAVMPFQGNYIEAGVKQQSHIYRSPIIAKEGIWEESAELSGSLVMTHSKRISISAIKKSELRDSLIVRLYNLTGESIQETLVLGKAAHRAWYTNILEERAGEITLLEPTTVGVLLEPYQIVTVEIEF